MQVACTGEVRVVIFNNFFAIPLLRTECLHPSNIHMLHSPPPRVMALGGGVWGPPHEWEEGPEGSGPGELSLLCHVRTQRENSSLQPRAEFSPEPGPAGTLVSASASKTL